MPIYKTSQECPFCESFLYIEHFILWCSNAGCSYAEPVSIDRRQEESLAIAEQSGLEPWNG